MDLCIDSLITIIVPVYNVDAYIDDCIFSIISQDYSDLEIILINDGSTDNSLEKCIYWASKDERIRYYTQENRGLSAARNKGVSIANGKYISFIDPDDIVEPDFISSLYSAIIEKKADISVGFLDFIGRTNSSIPVNISGTITTKEAMDLLCNYRISSSACVKLYKVELLREVPFIEGLLYEDNPFSFQIISKCDRVAICNRVLYHHRIRKGSITQTISLINFHDYIKALSLVVDCIEGYYSLSDYRVIERKIFNWVNIEFRYHEYYSAIMDKYDCLQVECGQRNLRQDIISGIAEIDKSELSRKSKLQLFIIRYVPWLFYLIDKIYKIIKKVSGQ